MRSQPTFAGGLIYVGSHSGAVYALDARTGCAHWTYQAGAEVRTGIVVEEIRRRIRNIRRRIAAQAQLPRALVQQCARREQPRQRSVLVVEPLALTQRRIVFRVLQIVRSQMRHQTVRHLQDLAALALDALGQHSVQFLVEAGRVHL